MRIRTLYYERSFDVAVFRVLLEKAERIRRELGVVPAFFGDEGYLRARLEALWSRDWRGERRLQASLFDEAEPEVEAARKAMAEGFYGHSEFSLPDVERRLQEALRRAGSPETLKGFVLDGLRYLAGRWKGKTPTPPGGALERRCRGFPPPSAPSALTPGPPGRGGPGPRPPLGGAPGGPPAL